MKLSRLQNAIQALPGAHQEPHEADSSLRAILDEMPVGVFLVDAQDKIFLRNRHFNALFGYSEEDVPTLGTWWKLAHPDPQYRRHAQQTLNSMRHQTPDGRTVWSPHVYTMQCKNGEQLHIEVAGVSTASGYICTFVNYTEHQLHETQLEEAKRQAELANHAKSDFLATMSHEIRTPMNGILGMLQLLQHTPLSARQQDYTQKAQLATRALLGIINDILDFSKVEAGKLSLDVEAFAIQALMQDLSVLIAATPGDKAVQVVFDLDAKVPPHLMGDAMRLRQVLLNLLANAVKFTGQGEVVVRIRVLEHDGVQARLEFSVTDTGIGIAPDKLAYIFEGFSQAESSIARRFGGTGLGLAISKRLVILMGGDLQARSTLGQGSCFHFTLNMPVAQVSIAEFAIKNEASVAPQPECALRLEGLRILLVEDNPLNQQIGRELLTREGAWIDVASGGLEGVEFATRASPPYDAILMDLQMPDIDGLEATRRIRADTSLQHIPIIAMTANAMESDKAQCRAVGMVDHIGKPVELDTLVAALVLHAGRHQPPQVPRPEREPEPVHRDLELASLDCLMAIARLGGNRQLYAQIAQEFLLAAPGYLSELRTAWSDARHSDGNRVAHTLKGVAATVGAQVLAARAARLEAVLRSHAAGEVAATTAEGLLAEVQSALDDALQALAQWLAAQPTAPSPQAAHAALVSPQRRPRILLVDDQPINIQVLYPVFSPDHEVFMATSGAQALQVCAAQRPDLILLDVVMPEMDGHEVCRRLKADPASRDIPVIFVTARSDPEEESLGLALGAVDFIPKPVHAGVVRARVRSHLLLRDALAQVQALNEGLEARVAERTSELQLALEQLRESQDSLALSEAKATLSLLIASVSHEMGTPLGNSAMAASALADQAQIFQGLVEAGTMKRSDFTNFLATIGDGTGMIQKNLTRANELLSNLRQVAADQASEQRRSFELAGMFQEVLHTLKPSLKRFAHEIRLEIEPGLVMDSQPGALGQVLINLINNAYLHAFNYAGRGVMTISAHLENDWVKLVFADDGAGIAPEHLEKLFTPFFSTKIGKGGTGLGLAIVHNLVTKTLGGAIRVQSRLGQGTRFEVDLPQTQA